MYIWLNCIYLYLNVYCQCLMLTVCTKGLRVMQFQFSVCMYCTCGRIDNKAVLTYWNNAVGNICWKKVWMLPHTYLLTNKVKEISYKIIHKFYPAKHYMKKFKSDISSSCSFCEDSIETVVHLLWHCPFTKKFGQDVVSFIRSNIYNDCILFWKDVVLGFIEYEESKRKQFYVVNLILLLAKFHIHSIDANIQTLDLTSLFL